MPNNKIVSILACAISALAVANAAHAEVITTLGNQDFTNGALVSGVAGFNAPSAGEAAPFDQFYGSDFSPAFSKSWTFNYAAPATIGGASISFGIFDHDAFLPGNQVASFTVDGHDLTAALNALFEASGGTQNEYNVYSLALSASTLADLADGSATFSLTLQGGGSQVSNGAGLDFSTLFISGETVPEPASLALVGVALAGLVGARRRSQRIGA